MFHLPLSFLLFIHVSFKTAFPFPFFFVVLLTTIATINKCTDMARNTASKRRYYAAVDFITSFEGRDNAAIATSICHIDNLLCEPFVILLNHANVAKVHGVPSMRIKTCANEDQIRIKFEKRGDYTFPVGIP